MKSINLNPKTKRFQKSMQVASLIVLFMLVALTKTNAITRYVNTTGTWGSNTPCYSTIQAAINASTNGDEIIVDAGTYIEALIINKEVTILGPNAAVSPNGGSRVTEAIINLNSNTSFAIRIMANNVTFKGFRIINSNCPGALLSGGATGAGSYSTIATSNVTIEKNLFTNLVGNAIYTAGSITTWAITDNNISNLTNFTTGGTFGSGISVWSGATGLSITNNTMSSMGHNGIQLIMNSGTGTNLSVQNNTISTVPRSGISMNGGWNTALISNNSITGANSASSSTDGGMKVQSLNTVTGLVISNNTFTSNFNGFYVQNNTTLVGKDIVVTNNDLSNNTNFSINNAATGGTLAATSNWYGTTSNVCSKISGSVTYMPFQVTSTVSGTGTGYNPIQNTTQNTYFCTIQSAINAANANDVIQVPAGTYAESLNINKALSILGPNANISPNGGSRATEAIINLSTGTRSIYINASNITIKGFEIINSANAGAIMAGSGISGISHSTPTNIVIEKNYMHDLNGAAILLLGNYTVRNCAWTINDNKIDRTTLGTYLGGGYGSGIKMWTGSNCTITNNVLTNIGFTGIDVGWIQNSTISGNTLTTLVDNGMQVVGTNSNLNITNNTITNANYPSATLGQGGIKLFGSPINLSVTNNIVTGSGSAFAVEPGNNAAGASVNNNNFAGNTYGVYHAGTGTLNATCNWYGSASHSTIAPKISGTVTFVSFLVSGTDNDLATSGFQPAPGTCTGVAVSTPTIGSSSAVYTSVSQTAITFTFTKGNGANRIIVAKSGSVSSTDPTNNLSYTANAAFGSGDALDGFVVYNGDGESATITNLTAGTMYHFSIYEYNSSGATILYSTSTKYSTCTTTSQPDADNDGVADADDQYPNDPYKAFNNNYPAATFGTLMYEDLWPGKGDYDFNDLVVDYKFNTITNADNNIVEISFTFVTRAIGGSLHNGFAFQLDGISQEKITSVTGSKASGASWISLNSNGTEAGQLAGANILVFDDAYELLPTQSGFSFVNVYPGSPDSGTDTTTILVKFLSNGVAPSGGTLSYSAFNTGLFNPYLIVGQDRGKEIHLADRFPTSKMNLTYFGQYQDRTNPSTGKYFKTADNLPWGINVDSSIPFPTERTDISEAYLNFIDWATSGGGSSINWFLDQPGNRNNIKLMNR